MKKLLLLFFMAFTATAFAQNNDFLVTMKGIGPFKIGMTKAQLEKVLAKKITLKYLSDKDSGYADTIKARYKNVDVILYLTKQYIDEDKTDIVLNGVRCNSPLCKTKSGIGIGDDKIKVINVYENNTLYIWPDWEDDTYTRRSKTKSVISLSTDEDENNIIIYLTNKKVAGFEVTYYEGD